MTFGTPFYTEKSQFVGKNRVRPSMMSIEEGMPRGRPRRRFRCPFVMPRLKVEKIEGGLMVAGVVIAANCQIALPSFGFLFMLIGVVLTAASYRGPGRDEDLASYAARVAFTGNSRILGPICIIIGVIMFSLGVLLCILARKARRNERMVGFHCPIHGDFYPAKPIHDEKLYGLSDNRVSCWSKISCLKRCFFWKRRNTLRAPPQCPYSMMPGARASVNNSPLNPCPTAMPFLITSSSFCGMVQSIGATLSPDQTFGSIRSLSATREIASFPLSRTPTPPSQRR